MIDARMLARKLLLAGGQWSGVAALAAPLLAGAGAILMLHRVTRVNRSPLGVNSHLAISPDFLDRLLDDLKRRGIAVVTLDELVESLASGRARRAIAITADDGWLDNLTEALPVFEAHDAPFTIYVAPGLTSGEIAPWWEVIEEVVAARDVISLPTRQGVIRLSCPDVAAKRALVRRIMAHLTSEVAEEGQQRFLREIGAISAEEADQAARRFMNWDEVRRLAAHRLVTIGAHTVHHYNLKRLERQAALEEMEGSVTLIERRTGLRPRHFAYPYGYAAAVGPREVELARQAGFVSAVTTRHGVLHAGHKGHRHALPRISVNGNFQRLTYMRPLVSGLMTPLANRGRRLVTV